MVMIYAWPDREVTQQDLDMPAAQRTRYELVTGIDSTMARANPRPRSASIARIIGCTPDYFTVINSKHCGARFFTKFDVDDNI